MQIRSFALIVVLLSVVHAIRGDLPEENVAATNSTNSENAGSDSSDDHDPGVGMIGRNHVPPPWKDQAVEGKAQSGSSDHTKNAQSDSSDHDPSPKKKDQAAHTAEGNALSDSSDSTATETSVRVATAVNDILPRLNHRILAFGGVFVLVAFLFFLRARKQAQEDSVYIALMNSTEQEI